MAGHNIQSDRNSARDEIIFKTCHDHQNFLWTWVRIDYTYIATTKVRVLHAPALKIYSVTSGGHFVLAFYRMARQTLIELTRTCQTVITSTARISHTHSIGTDFV